MQLLIVEILHTALINLGVINVTDSKVGYRINYYLFSLRLWENESRMNLQLPYCRVSV